MRKLGVYIGETVYGYREVIHVRKNTFVWYEIVRSLMENKAYVYDVSIWSVKGGYPKCDAWPNGRKPDAKLKTTEPKTIENTVIPIKDAADNYCINWENRLWQIKEYSVDYNYCDSYEYVTDLKIDQFGLNNSCHWEWEGEKVFSVMKNATVTPIYKHKPTLAGFYPSSLTIPDTVGDMIKEELKKSLEKSALNSCYGTGGFTVKPSFTISTEEIDKLFDNKNKETETMEKKTMTETDTFLKHINGITITSTYSKLDFGRFGDPYYIYYPEMDITEDMADTLLTVLLMAKRDYIHKIVFNPEKGTTTIHCNHNDPVTVRCKDGEFDYILGYNMARSKMYLGSDDYNWFNKIKNHRKTHIEYTEPKAKRTSKKGGKK